MTSNEIFLLDTYLVFNGYHKTVKPTKPIKFRIIYYLDTYKGFTTLN